MEKTPKKKVWKVDGCRVCGPITRFVEELKDNGYVLVEAKCKDFHFSEVSIRLEGIPIDKDAEYDMEKLQRKGPSTYVCECHWSTVRVRTIREEEGND